MSDPKNYLLDLPKSQRPQSLSIPEKWYPEVRDYWGISTTGRIFDPIDGVRAVVIHATAGVSSEGAMSVMRAGKASWHWLIPDEDEPAHGNTVWACAPETKAAWHVRNTKFHPAVNGGARKVNHWSLGIEIVNSQSVKKVDPFSDWQVEVTAKIVRYCWAKYPNLTQVVSHALLDPERRTDPGTHFPWQRFCDLVLTPDGDAVGLHEAELATPMSQLSDPPNGLTTCCAPANT